MRRPTEPSSPNKLSRPARVLSLPLLRPCLVSPSRSGPVCPSRPNSPHAQTSCLSLCFHFFFSLFWANPASHFPGQFAARLSFLSFFSSSLISFSLCAGPARAPQACPLSSLNLVTPLTHDSPPPMLSFRLLPLRLIIQEETENRGNRTGQQIRSSSSPHNSTVFFSFFFPYSSSSPSSIHRLQVVNEGNRIGGDDIFGVLQVEIRSRAHEAEF